MPPQEKVPARVFERFNAEGLFGFTSRSRFASRFGDLREVQVLSTRSHDSGIFLGDCDRKLRNERRCDSGKTVRAPPETVLTEDGQGSPSHRHSGLRLLRLWNLPLRSW